MPLATLDTVEQFWQIYNQVKLASELKDGHTYSVFKAGKLINSVLPPSGECPPIYFDLNALSDRDNAGLGRSREQRGRAVAGLS